MPSGATPVNLSKLVSDYLAELAAEGRSRHTVATYRQTLRHYLAWSGADTDPADVTRRDIKGFLAHRRDDAGDSPASLSARHSALSVFWEWLVTEEEVSENVVKKVTRPKVAVKPVPLITPEQMRSLLELEGATPFLTFRNRAILLVMWDTGVRVGELCSLTLDNVDLDRMTLTVNGKTGVRTVPFGKATGVALRRYMRRREYHPGKWRPFLWVGNRGGLSESMVQKMFSDYGKRVGLAKFHPHMTRHSFVHNMLEAGATITDVVCIGGWENATQVITRYGLAGRQERAFAAHRKLSPGDRLAK